MIGRKRCCCVETNCSCITTDGPNFFGLQIAFEDLVDTYVAGLAAVINGTHPIGTTYTGTTDSDTDGPLDDPLSYFCRAYKSVETETGDLVVNVPYTSGCTQVCDGTDTGVLHYYRVVGRIRPADDPLTQTRIEVDLEIWGRIKVCAGVVQFDTEFADLFRWGKNFPLENCETIDEELEYLGQTHLDSDGNEDVDMIAPCTDYQLDVSTAIVTVSVLTTAGP